MGGTSVGNTTDLYLKNKLTRHTARTYRQRSMKRCSHKQNIEREAVVHPCPQDLSRTKHVSGPQRLLGSLPSVPSFLVVFPCSFSSLTPCLSPSHSPLCHIPFSFCPLIQDVFQVSQEPSKMHLLIPQWEGNCLQLIYPNKRETKSLKYPVYVSDGV